MNVTFLGTGAGLPSKYRNVSSIALDLSQEIGETWLFDCGEATQHQILHTSIKPRKITKIFITHMHGDHIFGLPGLLSSRSFQDGTTPVKIYGPIGIRSFVENSLRLSSTNLSYRLSFIEVTDGYAEQLEGFNLKVKKLEHGIDSFGYRLTEHDRLGKLNVNQLKNDGIPPGPIYKVIKEQPTTKLDNGEVVNRDDYLGPPIKGRRISVMGDTRNPYQFKDFVSNSDLLIHEATFKHEDKELANRFYHSTTIEAAQLAKESRVKQLILTHLSARYDKTGIDLLNDEAQAIFKSTTIAEDLLEIDI
ncbi:ribonuclease Z [Pelagirhabdus alkalitolerans]|uniref:ribonuclease Z n=1 Tax=Pelagirhabdus alkalitolerans TaxID=1612202 RepID=UPI000B891C67|nr:ribonuclease Z [Pelagirhabdus alkalitolerans]